MIFYARENGWPLATGKFRGHSIFMTSFLGGRDLGPIICFTNVS